MSDIRIIFKMDKKTGKKSLVIDFEHDNSLLRHEHEKKHREFVEKFLENSELEAERISPKAIDQTTESKGEAEKTELKN